MLTIVTVAPSVVLAIVALNNAASPTIVMPVTIAVAAGLIGLGLAAQGK